MTSTTGLRWFLAALLPASILFAAKLFAATPPSKAKTLPSTAEERQAQTMLHSMTLRDRVAQLIIAGCDRNDPVRNSKSIQKYKHLIADVHIGGLICVNSVEFGLAQFSEPHAMAIFFN